MSRTLPTSGRGSSSSSRDVISDNWSIGTGDIPPVSFLSMNTHFTSVYNHSFLPHILRSLVIVISALQALIVWKMPFKQLIILFLFLVKVLDH